MSCAEVAMNKAMIERYHRQLGEFPEKGLILCIEDGNLGIDYDKNLSSVERKAMSFKLCVLLGCGSGWDSPCTGNVIYS